MKNINLDYCFIDFEFNIFKILEGLGKDIVGMFIEYLILLKVIDRGKKGRIIFFFVFVLICFWIFFFVFVDESWIVWLVRLVFFFFKVFLDKIVWGVLSVVFKKSYLLNKIISNEWKVRDYMKMSIYDLGKLKLM